MHTQYHSIRRPFQTTATNDSNPVGDHLKAIFLKLSLRPLPFYCKYKINEAIKERLHIAHSFLWTAAALPEIILDIPLIYYIPVVLLCFPQRIGSR